LSIQHFDDALCEETFREFLRQSQAMGETFDSSASGIMDQMEVVDSLINCHSEFLWNKHRKRL
jgi:hypothetical protein